MISEEEFSVFQNQLIQLGQENFRLKEKLEKLLQKNADLPKLKAELEECEKRREEMKAKHTSTIQSLKDELNELQKKITDEFGASSKITSDKIIEVNQQIAEVTRQTKEKESNIANLKQQVSDFDSQIQQKKQKLKMLQKKSKIFEPLFEFLRNSRAIPMYIEDLTMKISQLKQLKAKEEEKIAELDQQITALHRKNDDLTLKIQEKTSEIEAAKIKLKATSIRIDNANLEIKKAKKSLVDANNRLNKTREQSQKAEEEHQAKIRKIQEEKKDLENQIAEKELKRKELQDTLEESKSESNQELARLNTKVQQLRKKLASIKETGDDEEVPKVDQELQYQINHVIEEKSALEEKKQMLHQAIMLVTDKIKSKDVEIQTLTLSMPPTTRIISLPEFQHKQLLLEELVLQNRELKIAFYDMTEKIEQLKKGNNDLRELIKAKSAKK